MNRNNRRGLPRIPALLVLLFVVPACGSPAPDRAAAVVGGLPQGTLYMGQAEQLSLNVEIAETAGAQTRGLMNVGQIPEDYGMVFAWQDPGRHPFHMRDTLIPLDIAWWDEDGRIVDIQTMTPCRADPCETYHPASEHVAAVEVRAGLLGSSGIEVGDPVKLHRTSPPRL